MSNCLNNGGRGLMRRLLSGSAWACFSKFCGGASMVVVNVLLAALLAPSDLGTYFIIYSCANILCFVVLMGMRDVEVRVISQALARNENRRARHAVFLGAALIGMVLVPMWTISHPLFDLLATRLFDEPRLVEYRHQITLLICGMCLQQFLGGIYRGFGDIRLAALVEGAFHAIFGMIILTFAWFYGGTWNICEILFVINAASFGSILISICIGRRHFKLLAGTQGCMSFNEMLQISIPIWLVNVTVFAIGQADMWIAGAYCDKSDVAIYGAAQRLVNALAIPIVLINAVVPQFLAQSTVSSMTKKVSYGVRKLVTTYSFFTLLGFSIIVLSPGWIMQTLFGQFYREGNLILVILAASKVMNVVFGPTVMAMMMTGNERIAMYINIFLGICIILAGAHFSRAYGYNALGYVVLTGNTIRCIVFVVILYKITGLNLMLDLRFYKPRRIIRELTKALNIATLFYNKKNLQSI